MPTPLRVLNHTFTTVEHIVMKHFPRCVDPEPGCTPSAERCTDFETFDFDPPQVHRT